MQNEISHWDIHLRKSNHAGIIPTKLIQWSTYQNKFCATAFDQLGLYNRATQNRKFHEDLEHPLRKTMKDTFSVSNDRVFDLPFKFSSSFPHRLYFAILNQNRWSLKRANNKLKYPLIGNRIWWISLSRESGYLTIGGAKTERPKKREDFWIYHIDFEGEVRYVKKKWTLIRKHTQQLLGDEKLSAVIGWKRLTTIQPSMLLISGSVMKNLSTFLQPLQQRQSSCRGVTQINLDFQVKFVICL